MLNYENIIFTIIFGIFAIFFIWQLPIALEKDAEFSSRHSYEYDTVQRGSYGK